MSHRQLCQRPPSWHPCQSPPACPRRASDAHGTVRLLFKAAWLSLEALCRDVRDLAGTEPSFAEGRIWAGLSIAWHRSAL